MSFIWNSSMLWKPFLVETQVLFFHKLFGPLQSPSKTETAGSLQNCFLYLKMLPKWKMRRRSIWPNASLRGERKREEAELSRNLSQFKTLVFPQGNFGLFDKIANIILWNHRIANSHEWTALKDHLFWSKFHSMFESYIPYSTTWWFPLCWRTSGTKCLPYLRCHSIFMSLACSF